jgi:nitrate reductase delta subunit
MHDYTDLFNALAATLEYPGDDWRDAVARCEPLCLGAGEAIAGPFAAFTAATRSSALDELQELYVRTFELAPAATLEVGYHVFGETYKRGEFLAHLSAEEEGLALGAERQLPDYLPVLLRLLEHLGDDDLRRDLVGACMLPAIAAVATSLESSESPYRHLVSCVGAALEESLRLELLGAPGAEAISLIEEADHA